MRFSALLLMMVPLVSLVTPAYANNATPKQVECAIRLHEEARRELSSWTWEEQVAASGKDPKKLTEAEIKAQKEHHEKLKGFYESHIKLILEQFKFSKEIGIGDLKFYADMSLGATLVKEGIISPKTRDEFVEKCGEWLFGSAECPVPDETESKGNVTASSKDDKTMSKCTEKNYYGSYPKGGDCTYYGCYPAGGNCDYYGCHPKGGSCNYYGCTREGQCDYHGCPSPIVKDSYKCK